MLKQYGTMEKLCITVEIKPKQHLSKFQNFFDFSKMK